VILHDGIKTIQSVFFSIFFKEKTKYCFFLKKQVSVKKQENLVGWVFLKKSRFFSARTKQLGFHSG